MQKRPRHGRALRGDLDGLPFRGLPSNDSGFHVLTLLGLEIEFYVTLTRLQRSFTGSNLLTSARRKPQTIAMTWQVERHARTSPV